jgi:hypothetical protein
MIAEDRPAFQPGGDHTIDVPAVSEPTRRTSVRSDNRNLSKLHTSQVRVAQTARRRTRSARHARSDRCRNVQSAEAAPWLEPWIRRELDFSAES